MGAKSDMDKPFNCISILLGEKEKRRNRMNIFGGGIGRRSEWKWGLPRPIITAIMQGANPCPKKLKEKQNEQPI